MNFTQYMNNRIFRKYAHGLIVAIGEQRGSAYHADVYVDLADADIICNLDDELPNISGDHVRLGEVIEHLIYDVDLLRHLRTRFRSMLITIPYNAPDHYHVRIHTSWSGKKLLSVSGWEIVDYVPRKAVRLDRFIAYIRGAVKVLTVGRCGETVNALFFRLNKFLPIKPNGGYYYCIPGEIENVYEHNVSEFIPGIAHQEKRKSPEGEKWT